MLVVIILQVRSLPAEAMTLLTAPLRLVGVVPILLVFRQPFGLDSILGIIALAGILMRSTLFLVGQIKTNRDEGLDLFHAVVGATAQRSSPVVLTALAAVPAFVVPRENTFCQSRSGTNRQALGRQICLERRGSNPRPPARQAEVLVSFVDDSDPLCQNPTFSIHSRYL